MNASTQQWLIFSATQYCFAVDTNDIIEIVPTVHQKPDDAEIPGVMGWIEVQGAKVPVLDIINCLYKKSIPYQQNEIIVIQGKEQLIGLVVERVLAVGGKGHEQDLQRCIQAKGLSDEVHYLSPQSIAVMRNS